MNKLITVAVIDSGIYPHIDFKNRIVAFKDFVNGRKNAYDDCGHGTHVSGIIAGSGYASHGRIRGICPSACLAGIKVLDRLGNGRIENVLDAAGWIISHQKGFEIWKLSIYLQLQPRLAIFESHLALEETVEEALGQY